MAEVGVKELLQAGVHFGHQTRRWHPKMRRYIFGERDGIYIIDLLKTEVLLERARVFIQDLTSKGGVVLFVARNDPLMAIGIGDDGGVIAARSKPAAAAALAR